VSDIIKEKGALGGIYTGLFYTISSHAFVSACDMPFLNRGFIEYMVERAAGYDIVVPKPADGFQPLHAIYSKRCLPFIKKVLLTDNLKVTSFYRGLKTLTIPEDVIRSYDPEGRMFFNINTREDLERISSL
jgi:molybdopterin-guanine dinucleotide biosynthesis protein A